jgi:large subunit ribosomal protein L11e
MDFYVVLSRAGKRVARRRQRTNVFGKYQRITADDAREWFIQKYGGNVLN